MLVTTTRILPVKFKRINWNSKTWKSTGEGYLEWEVEQIERHYREIYPNAVFEKHVKIIWDYDANDFCKHSLNITLKDAADEAAFILGES